MTKKLGYIFASLVILLALMVVISHLLAPMLDKHHADIEAKASALLQMPVTVKTVSISWYRYQPEITLNTVTILNKTTRHPILQIQKVRVFFSIPQSLWHWRLVPSGIMLSGANLNLYQSVTGDVAVQGFSGLGGSEFTLMGALGWLSAQPRLILDNVDVHYTDKKGVGRYITCENLRFDNAGNSHVVIGKALLHQTVPTEVAITVQWYGDVTHWDKIKANAYLAVSHLSLSQWWKGYEWNGWRLDEGMANAKIWAWWHDGALKKTQSTFEFYGIDLFSKLDNSTHKINRISGDVGWKLEGQEQVFAGEDIFINLPNRLWPATNIYVSLKPNANGKWVPVVANVGYVNLQDAKEYLFASPMLLSSDNKALLSALKLTGDIQNMAVVFSADPTDWRHLSLTGTFSRLTVAPWQRFPGIKNLSGSVRWSGAQGELNLHSHQVAVQYDSIFSAPLAIDQLSGAVLWQQDQKQQWIINLQALQAFNSDLALNVNGTITVPAATPVTTDLQANFTMQRANQVTRYLPLRVFDHDLVAWLQAAFLSGTVSSGNATLRGALKDFPFDDQNGLFQVVATTKDVDFHFAPDWPDLKNVNGTLTFKGHAMQVAVSHAEIGGMAVSNVQGAIPYLGEDKPSILTVQADKITADCARGLAFIHQSPLEKTIGKMFADTKMEGPLDLALNLTVPLSNPDKTAVSGNVAFTDAILHLEPWQLTINHLKGELQFTESMAKAKSINGELFGKPLLLSLQTLQKTKTLSVLRATVANDLAISDLESWLKLPTSSQVKGSAAVKMNIDFSPNAPIDIHLQSNLLGVTIAAAGKYGKKSTDVRPLVADIIVTEKQPLRLNVSYANLLGAALILERKTDAFNLISANIRFGSGLATWPTTQGLFISGNLDRLDWDDIKPHLSQSTSSDRYAGLSLQDIDVTISKLSLPIETLTNVHLNIQPVAHAWNIALTSAEVDGQLSVPLAFTPQNVVTARFQKLNLQTSKATQIMTNVVPQSLPAISFAATNVSYGSWKVGQVNFKTTPTATGLVIKPLVIAAAQMDLRGDGTWTSAGTMLQGAITSTNVSRSLNELGFDAHNLVAGKGRLDFNLNWHNPPYALSLASMSGRTTLDLGQGRIVELSQTNGAKMDLGRLLNIFSLQTIPRRLSLDFSDVLQKGYSFDFLRGDFKFENGNAFTSNTRFDGPVARVDIYGRIGLQRKDVDMTLSVTPYVTSSIPVAATLLTGQPAIGLAAWAVDKVISPSVSKATTYYYAVSGGWNNPTWDSVKVPKKK